jgi:hypothetical protein
MKMSSRRPALEGGLVAQHRPQNIDPPTCQSNESLGVPLAFRPLAIVESPGLWCAAQAGKGRLVEDPLENLVSSSHPFVVADPLAGVAGRRDKPCIGGEPVGTLESTDVTHGHQELLGPEDRSHAWQASKDPSLGTGEKTLL